MSNKSPARNVLQPRPKHPAHWELRVYVAGAAARSTLTIENLERLCKEHLPGQYRIRIVDLMKSPELSRIDQIIAVPTVVRHLPLPERRVIGTLSDTAAAVAAMGMGQ